MTSPVTAGTILVVDDSDSMCNLLEVILVRAGFRVLTAVNGAEALRLACNTPQIDLLVSDLEMPGMRGDELATRFARLRPSVPILFVSSSDRSIETTVPFEFLPKPFTAAALRDTVHRLLRTRPACAETPHDPKIGA